MSPAPEQPPDPEVGFEAEMVERRARIFRFGHFPTKVGGAGWTCTRDEFVAFNGESGTVPIGVDPVRRGHYFHEPRGSIFDGRTGEAAFTVEGEEVYATLRTPPMVMESALEHGLRISSVFRSAADKTLTKVDLVDTPHFDDAVIFEAESGGVMVAEDEEPEPVEFCGPGAHEAYQTMHDLSCEGRPGLCSGEARGKGKVGFARESADDRLMRQMHHHAVHKGAYCPGMPDGIDHEEVGMSAELDDDIEQPAAPEPEPVSFTAEDIKAMQAEIARLRTDNVREKAVAFAREVTTGADARVLPALRKKIEEGYEQAAQADASLPQPVAFTEDQATRRGSRVDAFRSLILALPKLGVAAPKASGKAAEVAFAALDMEPSEGAEHEKREAERREERRRQTQARAASENGSGGHRNYSG